jgi:cardiolipin synthase
MNLTVPNVLTLLRMALVPLFIIWVLDGYAGRALAVFIGAGLTDALDGFIARFWNQRSLLGSYLDPIADKLLLVSAWVVLSIPSLHATPIPLWVTVLVIARDVLILIVALVFYLAVGLRSFPPSLLSKATTVIQVVTVAAVLGARVFADLEPLAETLIYAVAVFTLLSGLDYGRRYSRLIEEKETPAG